MSFMFEVYYKSPPDARREETITEQVNRLGGRLTHRETPEDSRVNSVCLTYEFDDLQVAEIAAAWLRRRGKYVEGPVDYGD